MKTLNKIFSSLVLFLVLCNFSFAQEQKEWTLLVYFNGHGENLSFLTSMIKDMEEVGSTPAMNIVVQEGRKSEQTIKRYYVEFYPHNGRGTKPDSPIIEEFPRHDMGNVDNLIEFIKWGVQKYPARKYMISMWGHGGGIYGMSPDEIFNNIMRLPHIGRAMAEAKKVIGHEVEIFNNFACAMSVIEMLNEIKDDVKIYVAADSDIRPKVNFVPMVKALKENPLLSSEKLVQIVTSDVVVGFGDTSTTSFRLTKFDDVLNEFNKLIDRILSMTSEEQKTWIRNIYPEMKFSAEWSYRHGDLLQLAKLSHNKNPELLSKEEMSSLELAYNNLVISQHRITPRDTHGLMLWFPQMQDQYFEGARDRIYPKLKFNQSTRWAEVAPILAKEIEELNRQRRD